MSSFDTPLTQRVTALEDRMKRLGDVVNSLQLTEQFASGAGDPSGVVNGVQGTIYVRTGLTPEMYFNASVAGTPPEGTTWNRFGVAGGGSAPANAQYLTLAGDATLTQERIFTPTVGHLVGADGGAGNPYTLSLATTAVAAGVYGSATQSPQITVDAYGRITNAVNVAISGVPPAAHSLLGAYHNDTSADAPTRGSIIVGNVIPLWDELVLGGVNGSVLTRNATDVLWSATTGILGSGAAGQVAYFSAANTITSEATFEYDAANNRLGVNQAGPSYTLDIGGIIGVSGIQTIYNAGAISVSYSGTLYVGDGGGALSHVGGTDAYRNTGVGVRALFSNTTGAYNTAIGNSALFTNTTGSESVAIGYAALEVSLTASNNVAIGSQSARATTSGNNTSVGAFSLQSNTTGDYNVAVGVSAGASISGGGANSTGTNSIFIGYDTRVNANGETNQIVIGHMAIGRGSNTATIGTTSTTDFYAYGNHVTEASHFIGDDPAGARLYFNSAGATNYAYFMSCNLGVQTTTPTLSPSPLAAMDFTVQLGDNTLQPELRLAGPNSTDVSSKIVFDNSNTGDGYSIFFNSNSGSTYGPDGLVFYDENGGSLNLKFNRDSGLVGWKTANPAAAFDISYGSIALLIGADAGTTSRTDATSKYARVGSYHYTNAEEPVGLVYATSDGTDNIVYFGGGSTSFNAATSLRFYTAANDTTQTGSLRMTINSSGDVGIGRAPTVDLDVYRSGSSAQIKVETVTSGTASMRIIDSSGGDILLRGDTGVSYINSGGRFAVGATSASGMLHVDQASGSAGIPVIYMDQGNNSQPFYTLAGFSGAGTAYNLSTMVGTGAVTGPGSDDWDFVGLYRVYIVDANSAIVGTAWVPLYQEV